VLWDDIKDSFVMGSKYRYFYVEDGQQQIKMTEIAPTNIFFGDEQNANIQEQPYIIISQRRPVQDVREEARTLGAKAADVESIQPDTDTDNELGDNADEEGNQGISCIAVFNAQWFSNRIYVFRVFDNILRVHKARKRRLFERLLDPVQLLIDGYLVRDQRQDLSHAPRRALNPLNQHTGYGGAVDPTKASGTAILAVQRSAELPVSEAVEAYIQYLEDIALIWYDLWSTYAVDGLQVAQFETETGAEGSVIVPSFELQNMKINVRIDVSPTAPFDKLSAGAERRKPVGSGAYHVRGIC